MRKRNGNWPGTFKINIGKKCNCLLFPCWDYGPCAHKAARISGGFGWIYGCQSADWRKVLLSNKGNIKARIGLAAATSLPEASSTVHVCCIQTAKTAGLVCWFCHQISSLIVTLTFCSPGIRNNRVVYLLFVCFGWWHNFVKQAWLLFPLS